MLSYVYKDAAKKENLPFAVSTITEFLGFENSGSGLLAVFALKSTDSVTQYNINSMPVYLLPGAYEFFKTHGHKAERDLVDSAIKALKEIKTSLIAEELSSATHGRAQEHLKKNTRPPAPSPTADSSSNLSLVA